MSNSIIFTLMSSYLFTVYSFFSHTCTYFESAAPFCRGLFFYFENVSMFSHCVYCAPPAGKNRSCANFPESSGCGEVAEQSCSCCTHAHDLNGSGSGRFRSRAQCKRVRCIIVITHVLSVVKLSSHLLMPRNIFSCVFFFFPSK